MAVGDAGLQEEHLDVLIQTGQKTEEMCIEMGITIEQFMCGFTPRIRKNCFSNGTLTARIHGRDFRISPAPATYPPVTRRL